VHASGGVHPGFDAAQSCAGHRAGSQVQPRVCRCIALVARKVGLHELTDEFVTQPQVANDVPSVRTSTTDTHCPIEPIFALTDHATIELKDGRRRRYRGNSASPRNAKLPLGDAALKTKFLDLQVRAALNSMQRRCTERLNRL